MDKQMVDETIREAREFLRLHGRQEKSKQVELLRAKRRALTQWLLRDWGIPANAIVIDPTEKEAKKAGIGIHRRDVPRADLQVR